jgi:hypothetical protein
MIMLPKTGEIASNDDNVTQARGDFIKMMITLSKSVGDSFEKGGELPTADLLWTWTTLSSF